MMNNEEKYTVDGFKKWISEHGGLSSADDVRVTPKDKHVGLVVERKMPAKKIAARLEAVSGDFKDLMLDFLSDGGTIVEVEDEKFLIEVESGRFYRPRHCVRRVESR